ncbi:hypothetical protein ACEPAG_1714 [Sanghuangporus baumii]
MSYYQTLHVLSDTSSEFSAVVRTAEIELCVKVALASLLFYHTITTIDKEMKYFWHTPWKQVHMIFHLNRYIGLVSIFISIQRTSVTWIHSIAGKPRYFLNAISKLTEMNGTDWATVLAIDFILLQRVFALFNNVVWFRSVLSVLLALEASLRLAFMIVAVRAEIEEQKHLPVSTACVEQSKCSQQALETAYWIAPAAFQIILLILASSDDILHRCHHMQHRKRPEMPPAQRPCLERNNGRARKLEPFVPAWKYAIDQS